jgi:heme-degrading monooxygenase HmoA
MRYMRVSAYDIVKGTFRELSGLAEKGILPLLSRAPGFVDYGLIDAGRKTVVAISIWETREEAQTATRMAAKWIKDNIADRVQPVSTYVGDLALSHSVRIRGLSEALRARAAA